MSELPGLSGHRESLITGFVITWDIEVEPIEPDVPAERLTDYLERASLVIPQFVTRLLADLASAVEHCSYDNAPPLSEVEIRQQVPACHGYRFGIGLKVSLNGAAASYMAVYTLLSIFADQRLGELVMVHVGPDDARAFRELRGYGVDAIAMPIGSGSAQHDRG